MDFFLCGLICIPMQFYDILHHLYYCIFCRISYLILYMYLNNCHHMIILSGSTFRHFPGHYWPHNIWHIRNLTQEYFPIPLHICHIVSLPVEKHWIQYKHKLITFDILFHIYYFYYSQAKPVNNFRL